VSSSRGKTGKEYRGANVLGEESAVRHRPVTVDGHVDFTCRQAPVRRISIAGGHLGLFQPIRVPPIFSIFSPWAYTWFLARNSFP